MPGGGGMSSPGGSGGGLLIFFNTFLTHEVCTFFRCFFSLFFLSSVRKSPRGTASHWEGAGLCNENLVSLVIPLGLLATAAHTATVTSRIARHAVATSSVVFRAFITVDPCHGVRGSSLAAAAEMTTTPSNTSAAALGITTNPAALASNPPSYANSPLLYPYVCIDPRGFCRILAWTRLTPATYSAQVVTRQQECCRPTLLRPLPCPPSTRSRRFRRRRIILPRLPLTLHRRARHRRCQRPPPRRRH